MMNKSKQQKKITAIFIFAIAILALGKGIGEVGNTNFNFLHVIMIVCGLVGAILAGYTFFKAK